MTTKLPLTYLLTVMTFCAFGQVDLKNNFSKYYKNAITTVHLDSHQIGTGCNLNASYLACQELAATHKYKLDKAFKESRAYNSNSPDSLVSVIKIKEYWCNDKKFLNPQTLRYIISKNHRFCGLTVETEIIKTANQTMTLDKRETYYYIDK